MGSTGSGFEMKMPVPFSTVNRRTVRRVGGVVLVTGASHRPSVQGGAVGAGVGCVDGDGVGVGATISGTSGVGVAIATGTIGWTGVVPPPQAAARSAAPQTIAVFARRFIRSRPFRESHRVQSDTKKRESTGIWHAR